MGQSRVNIRVTRATYLALVMYQKALREQKGEEHMLMSIMEKLIVNADVRRLYGITVDMGEVEGLERVF